MGETGDKELTTDDKVKDPNKDKEADKVENDNIIDLNAADTEGKVVISATDPNNYPTDAGKLVGDDKYIYQIVTLNDTSSRLVLAINRNDHNDESIYAYVTNSNYSSASQTFEIKVGNNRVITVGNHKYQINNTGKSDVTIDNGNGTTTKVPTENTSTITGQPGWIDTDTISPIYGLGNTTNNNYTALGEIIPVYTENSVIKYYYKDSEGKLHEIEGSDQYPNIIVSGLTGQEFEIKNVDQFKQIINGYYLIPDNLPSGDFKGTLSQFKEGEYYKKVYYEYGSSNVEFYVVYNQISPDGTMRISLFDGDKTTAVESHVVAPGQAVQFSNYNYLGRNPFVTSTPHEVQFIYSQLGSIIPVDEQGNVLGPSVQFNNGSDAFSAGATKAPEILGYTLKYQEQAVITPTGDLSKDIYVVYVPNNASAEVIFQDVTTGTPVVLDTLTTNGSHGYDISFTTNPLDMIKEFEKKGYVLVSNGYGEGGHKFDSTNPQSFLITFKHGVFEITPENPGKPDQPINPDDPAPNPPTYPADSDKLTTTITQTIKYVYSNGLTAAPDSVQTITFTAKAYIDKVTGEYVLVDDQGNIIGKADGPTWNADSGTFGEVISPTIPNYTADKTSIPTMTVNRDGNNITITVTYTRTAQKAEFVFQDITDNKEISSNTVEGEFDKEINFNPQTVIDQLISQGYELVNNPFVVGTKFKDDEVNPNANKFIITLKHGIEEVTREETVDRVIHYVYQDGSTAKPSITQTATFVGTGTRDKVTGQEILTWSENVILSEVTSPTISGYTPNRLTVSEVEVSHDSSDIEETVTYIAGEQTAEIYYVDIFNSNDPLQLGSDSVIGKFGEEINFNLDPVNLIKYYESQGYKLVSNSFTPGTKYGNSEENPDVNVFYVYFTHATKEDTTTVQVSQTINYKYDDGTTARPSNVQTITFTGTGLIDLTTGELICDPNTGETIGYTWTTDKNYFDAVESPDITNYTPTIKVVGQSDAITHEDTNRVIDVIYAANIQQATITYIDKTTGQTIKVDSVEGKYKDKINYSTQSVIDELVNKGYVLVSDSFSPDAIFTEGPNKFWVYLEHGIKAAEEQTATTNRVIHYVYVDGSTARPSVIQTITYKGTGKIDAVTGELIGSYTWTTGSYDEVESPKIQGYSPDILIVESVADVQHTTGNSEVQVTYIANKQSAQITFIDVTDNKVISSSEVVGNYGDKIIFTDNPEELIKQLEAQGYVLVSKSYDGDFNHSFSHDNDNNIFEVRVKHGTESVTDHKTITQTIKYQYENGTMAAQDHVVTLTFTGQGVIDKVTGKYVIVNANGDVIGEASGLTWTADNGDTFARVDSPTISGYGPNKLFVEEMVVNQDSNDIVEVITYYAGEQTAEITYIDETTGEILSVDSVLGKLGEDINFTTAPGKVIEQLLASGYELVSNNFTQGTKYGNSEENPNVNIFEVRVKHGVIQVNPENPGKPDTPINPDDPNSPVYPTDSIILDKDVERVIEYVFADGTTAAPSVVQVVKFQGSGYIDKVTGKYVAVDQDGKIILDENGKPVEGKLTWVPVSGSWDAQVSPTIDGYTPDMSEVLAQVVNPEDANQTVKVTYNANRETAQITYIDETTGQVIRTDYAYDVYGNPITFENDPRKVIEELEKMGYVVVDPSGFTFVNGETKYGDSSKDAQVNHFVVRVTHGYVEIKPEDNINGDDPINPDDPDGPTYPFGADELNKDINRVIHYVYENGTTAKPSVTQTLNFKGTAYIDKVTGQLVQVKDGKIVVDENGKIVQGTITWVASDGTTFEEVVSPSIDGYTPDKDKIQAVDGISADHGDLTETVVYKVDKLTAQIEYIDQTTGEVLESDKADGVINEVIKFSKDPAEVIANLIKLGYKVVTNDYTEGAVYQKDAQKNIFKVYLVKDTTPGGDDKPDPEPTPDPTPTPDPEPTPTPTPDPEPTPDEKPTPEPDEDKPTPSTPDKDDKDKDDSSDKGDTGNKGNNNGGNAGDGNNKVDHEVVVGEASKSEDVNNAASDQVAESENTESTEEAPMVHTATVDENVSASEVDNDNGNTNTQEAKETLPQTGAQESKAGIFGLLLAAVGSLFGLAGTRRRKDK